jgi:hypothetical protein
MAAGMYPICFLNEIALLRRELYDVRMKGQLTVEP